MQYYPALVVAVDDSRTVVRFEDNGHQIAFAHSEPNAVPSGLRNEGARGFVSFPKAPPIFTESAAA